MKKITEPKLELEKEDIEEIKQKAEDIMKLLAILKNKHLTTYNLYDLEKILNCIKNTEFSGFSENAISEIVQEIETIARVNYTKNDIVLTPEDFKKFYSNEWKEYFESYITGKFTIAELFNSLEEYAQEGDTLYEKVCQIALFKVNNKWVL